MEKREINPKFLCSPVRPLLCMVILVATFLPGSLKAQPLIFAKDSFCLALSFTAFPGADFNLWIPEVVIFDSDAARVDVNPGGLDCIHSHPAIGPLQPGESGSVRGIITIREDNAGGNYAFVMEALKEKR